MYIVPPGGGAWNLPSHVCNQQTATAATVTTNSVKPVLKHIYIYI